MVSATVLRSLANKAHVVLEQSERAYYLSYIIGIYSSLQERLIIWFIYSCNSFYFTVARKGRDMRICEYFEILA